MNPDFPIYSPEEQIAHPLLEEKEIRLTIKRDDMIHPFVSGNKWRKLKYNVDEMRRTQRNHIVTFGGIWSNHLLATACAAAKLGIKATAFVRGEPIDSDSLFLYKMFGMNLIYTDRQAYRDKLKLYNDYFAHDPSTYFVNEGGSGLLGARGCSETIQELTGTYDHIFTAAGTGTTAAGILHGIEQYQEQAELHVVPVLKGAAFMLDDIRRFSESMLSFQFHDEYHFGGYAKYTPELLRFIQDFTSHTGILIDQVYTGKMLFALFDMIRKDKFTRGSRICAVHTGGVFGLLGVKKNFVF